MHATKEEIAEALAAQAYLDRLKDPSLSSEEKLKLVMAYKRPVIVDRLLAEVEKNWLAEIEKT